MYIANVIIDNFRAYHGSNSIAFSIDPVRNISLICGENGRGKTTLLTAMVWCLYGKQMQDVDRSYREALASAGGYQKYLRTCINKTALTQGTSLCRVTLNLADVELPGVKSQQLELTRSYVLGQEDDQLEITIDGKKSELVSDTGQQMFIQDFIMAKEIAKFFFFDAEKIVALAESQSSQESKLLSVAYAEVLGIRKYEELKHNLRDLRIRFRKDSASEAELGEFQTLGKAMATYSKAIDNLQRRRDLLIEERSSLLAESESLHERLLREGGSHLSGDEVKELASERERLLEEAKGLKSDLKEMLDLAPFAIAGKLVQAVRHQLNVEHDRKKTFLVKRLMEERIEQIVKAFRSDGGFDLGKGLDQELLLCRIRDLLVKHLIQQESQGEVDSVSLHDFSEERKSTFDALYSNLVGSYREQFRSVVRAVRINASECSKVSSRLQNAETIQNDPLIKTFRNQKVEADTRAKSIDAEIMGTSGKLGELERSLKLATEDYEHLAAKVRVNEQFAAKDQLVNRLISELDVFLTRFKTERKDSLERRLEANLKNLMHKADFIDRVTIQVGSESLEIQLFDSGGNVIEKGSLSRGEQQLYATALLLSLVQEAKSNFPIFIDSPLQKLDASHARNIITMFYPKVARQVVLLPLIQKELTKTEYELMSPFVASLFIIRGHEAGGSKITTADPSELFPEEIGSAVN